MKVLVTGGTGYIGQAVALRLKKAGHVVFALVRSKEKAGELLKAQVKLIEGDMGNTAGWAASAYGCAAVVHCASQMGEGGVELDRKTVVAARDLLRGQVGATLVYTSGCWVYGESGDSILDEEAALKPAKIVGWRPAHEKLALEASKDGTRAIVVRPGVVYGGKGGIPGGFFSSAAQQGAARVVGDGRNRWPMVHVDDLAELYVRLVERAPAGSIFNATDPSRLTVKDIAVAASRAAGKAGEIALWPVDQARAQLGVFADAICMDQRLSSEKAQNDLDWRPRHVDFTAEAEALFAAWKAGQA
jgi:nucleoside-diphosphate-sugar epimerase